MSSIPRGVPPVRSNPPTGDQRPSVGSPTQTSDSDADYAANSGSDFGSWTDSTGTADSGDIDAGLPGSSSDNSGDTSKAMLHELNSGISDGDIDALFSAGTGDEYNPVNIDTTNNSNDAGGSSDPTGNAPVLPGGTQPTNLVTSPYQGAGAPGDLQGFKPRPYSKNAEDMFGTFFDPKNASAGPNGSMNIHMQGNAGAEITAAKDATAYGSYTTTTKTQNVHGANQAAFFYGEGRKLEVDLFEPALHGGDVNTFTSGVWLDNVKVAETSIKASDLGFKSFHDQPMTYKMDFTPGNIKISALNSKGEWQTVVNCADPRITDQLARDTHFKEMFSAWGVKGEYNGAPVDFQVLKTGYSAQTI